MTKGIGAYRWRRLEIEEIVTSDMSLADPIELKAILRSCFWCSYPLKDNQLKTAHGLCDSCLERELWKWN